MNVLTDLGSTPLVEALGWTLLHFIWQGALIAAVLGLVLSAMRRNSAALRYLVCLAGMVAMILCPPITLFITLRSAVGPLPAINTDLITVNLDALPFWHRIAPALPWITLVWLAGVCFFQARLLLQFSRAQHLKHHGTKAAPDSARRMLRDLCAHLGVRPAVQIFESTRASVPMVMGWISPVILIPAGALTGLTGEQLRTVIAHELAHVRRHDYLVNLIQAVFESLLFYHPAVWWLSGRLRVEREYCCDDVAMSVCRDALCYARALSSLESLRSDGPQPALASTGGSLMNRIFRIVGVRNKPCRRTGGWIAPTVIAVSVLAAGAALLASPAAWGGEDKGEKVAVFEKIDFVALAKKAEFERTEVLAKLRKAGLDNHALAIVFVELGASEKQIAFVKQAIKEAEVKTKKGEMVKHAAPPPSKEELKKKEQAIIKKMKADGASDKEIKAALNELHAKYAASKTPPPPPSKDDLKKKEQMLIEKMIADGASKKEIQAAVEKLHKSYEVKKVKKVKKAPPPSMKELEKEYAAKEKMLVQKMKEDGASDKEIKHAVKKLRSDFEAYFAHNDAPPKKMKKEQLEKLEELKKKEQLIIQKMKADGASEKEIKAELAKLHKEYEVKAAPPKKVKKMSVEQKRKLLYKDMKAAGMTDDEIKRVIKAMEERMKKEKAAQAPPKKKGADA